MVRSVEQMKEFFIVDESEDVLAFHMSVDKENIVRSARMPHRSATFCYSCFMVVSGIRCTTVRYSIFPGIRSSSLIYIFHIPESCCFCRVFVSAEPERLTITPNGPDTCIPCQIRNRAAFLLKIENILFSARTDCRTFQRCVVCRERTAFQARPKQNKPVVFILDIVVP